MPLIDFIPMNGIAEDYLESETNVLRLEIKDLVHRVWGVLLKDVIVTAFECTTLNTDPDGADVVASVRTNPNEDIEVKADELRDKLFELWHTHWDKSPFKEHEGYISLDLWLQFIPGSWGLAMTADGPLTDFVDHVVKAQ